MPTTDFDFSRMLWPVDPEEFLRDTWERQPLALTRGEPGHYAGLFDPDELEELLCFTRPRFVGAEKPAGAVLRGLAEDAATSEPLGPIQLRTRYAQGQTLLLHGVQSRHRGVARFCRALEAALRHPVNVNLYLTPAGSQGFGPHYDDHDVFILQIHGSKVWRLYEPVRPLPLKFDEETVPRERLSPPREERLSAGDLLYLPRGHVHEAFAAAEPSLHLTVGVEVYRWADLVASAIARVAEGDVRLRRALPVGLLGSPPDGDAARGQLDELLRLVCERARWDDAVADLGGEFVRRLRAVPAGRFVDPIAAESVELDTPLDKPAATVCQVVDEGGSVSILFPGNQVRGPASIGPALRFLAAARGPIRPRDLPGNLSDSAKLTLARRLLHEGLLRRLDPPA